MKFAVFDQVEICLHQTQQMGPDMFAPSKVFSQDKILSTLFVAPTGPL